MGSSCHSRVLQLSPLLYAGSNRPPSQVLQEFSEIFSIQGPEHQKLYTCGQVCRLFFEQPLESPKIRHNRPVCLGDRFHEWWCPRCGGELLRPGEEMDPTAVLTHCHRKQAGRRLQRPEPTPRHVVTRRRGAEHGLVCSQPHSEVLAARNWDVGFIEMAVLGGLGSGWRPCLAVTFLTYIRSLGQGSVRYGPKAKSSPPLVFAQSVR